MLSTGLLALICCRTYFNYSLTGRFSEFEKNHPELVAIDTREQPTGAVMDFCELQANSRKELSLINPSSVGAAGNV